VSHRNYSVESFTKEVLRSRKALNDDLARAYFTVCISALLGRLVTHPEEFGCSDFEGGDEPMPNATIVKNGKMFRMGAYNQSSFYSALQHHTTHVFYLKTKHGTEDDVNELLGAAIEFWKKIPEDEILRRVRYRYSRLLPWIEDASENFVEFLKAS
jgi:hypothetical protein